MQRKVGGLSADQVADHVDAAPAGRVEDGLREVLARAVDRELGAELAAEAELLGASGRGEDTRAAGRAELHCRRSDAAGSGVHALRDDEIAFSRAERRCAGRPPARLLLCTRGTNRGLVGWATSRSTSASCCP
jgi:hypothetical protein